MFRRQLPAAIGMVILFTLITGVAYPMVMTAFGQTLFHDKAEGSLIERDGVVVGSRLIGQQFTQPDYFHPRPSAAGDGYDAAGSSGSNTGPTNEEWLAEVETRVAAYRDENGLGDDVDVPVDAVTASASGLDPHISVANAQLQANRVAEARGLDVDVVNELIDDHTDSRDLGVLGEPGVNVLELNLALDDVQAGSAS